MNLAQGYERRGWVAGDSFGEKLAVAGYDCAVVGFSKAEIELAGRIFSTVGPAEAAATGAEAVPEPAEFSPFWDWKPLNSIGGDAGRWSRLAKFFRSGAVKMLSAGKMGLSAQITHQAGGVKKVVDGLDRGVGKRFRGGGRRHLNLILAGGGFYAGGDIRGVGGK